VVVTVCSIALSLLLIRENKNMEAAGEFTHEEELGEISGRAEFRQFGCVRERRYICYWHVCNGDGFFSLWTNLMMDIRDFEVTIHVP